MRPHTFMRCAGAQSNRSLSHLHFIHIPKAAGTSIEDLGLKLGVHWGRHAGRPAEQPAAGPYSYCSPWHVPTMPPHSMLADDETFCVLRAPSTRWVSQWHHEHRLNSSVYCDGAAFAAWSEHTLDLMSTPKANGAATNMRDCHFVGQALFLPHCDYALRYEQLAEDLAELLACYAAAPSSAAALRPFLRRHSPTSFSVETDECAARFAEQAALDVRFQSIYAADIEAHQRVSQAGGAAGHVVRLNRTDSGPSRR